MADADPAATRADLERTGNLFTQLEDDPGHIPAFWRKRISELCDALEATSGAEVAATPRTPQEEVDALTRRVRDVLAPGTEAALARAVLLIEEAMPRMRTLNNATSQRWIPLAEQFLVGGKT